MGMRAVQHILHLLGDLCHFYYYHSGEASTTLEDFPDRALTDLTESSRRKVEEFISCA
jgi:hypothetical protein